MARFKLLIEYAGTRYSGWQIQNNARTVQGEIDRAVSRRPAGGEFELYGSGRTDAGVHALAQVAHLDVYTTLPRSCCAGSINDELPADIHIRSIVTAPHRFHARHDARSRSYLYQISRRRTAFAKPFVWWIREPLEVGRDAGGGGSLRRDGGFRGLHGRRSGGEVDQGVCSSVSSWSRSGALVLVRVAGLALPVEDGAPDCRCAGRGRPGRNVSRPG